METSAQVQVPHEIQIIVQQEIMRIMSDPRKAIKIYAQALEESDNRRIEACGNIIKICRNISVELQRVTTTEAA